MVEDSPGSSKRKSTADNEDSEHGKKQMLHIAEEAEVKSSSEKYSQSEEDSPAEDNTISKMYATSQGPKNTLHGIIYQLKLLMLFLWRGKQLDYSFRLATEMDKAEDFDDLVFEYKVKTESEPFYRFLQATHKLDENKKISARDLLTESKTDDDFSLQKYLISYRRIRNHSEFKSEMRKDFIICTNIDFDSDELKAAKILPQKVNGPDDFLNIESETKESARYKLRIAKGSKPWEILKQAAHGHHLAKILVDHVFKPTTQITLHNYYIQLYHTALVEEVIDVENKKFFSNFVEGKNLPVKVEKFREIFCAEVSARLAKEPKKPKEPKEVPSASAIRKKIEENPLKVSLNFGQLGPLSTNCTQKSRAEFSKELVNLISEAENYLVKVDPEKYKEDAEAGSKERVFADNINELGGHMLIRNDEKIKFRRQFLRSTKLTSKLKLLRDSLETGLGTKYADLGKYQFDMPPYFKISDEDLPVDEVNDEDIKEFLKNLIFAVNQPNEIELGDLITSELGADNRFNLLTADLVGASFQKEILDWFKEKGKRKGQEGRFYSHDDAKGFFKSIKEKVDSVVNLGLSLSYREKLKGYRIKFAEKNQELESFLKSNFSDEAKSALNLITALDTLPTAIRVQQAIQEFNSYETDGSLMFLRLRTMQSNHHQSSEIKKRVTLAFSSPDSHHLLVIDCESATEKGIQELYNRLRQTMKETNEMIKKRTKTTMKKNYKKLIFITRDNEPSSDRQGVLLKNCQETRDNVSFKHLTTDSQLKLVNKDVISFQGDQQRTSFGKLLDIRDCDDIVMQELGGAIDPSTLMKLIRHEEIKIGSYLQGLGKIEQYYIPRTVDCRVLIKRDVFESHSEFDVLAVSGCPPGIDLPGVIILERDNEDKAFEELCRSTRKNVHWLNYWGEGMWYFWYRSQGDITSLMKYRDLRKGIKTPRWDPLSSFKDYRSECELDDHDDLSQVVIISDFAGTGKTTMLTYLAKKIKEKRPGHWVIRINLNNFTEVLFQELQDKQLESKSHDASHPDRVVEFFVEKFSKLEGELDRRVLKSMIEKQSCKVVLLFDGFDEICPDYTDTVIYLLQGLQKIGTAKLFVATRPHMRELLDEKLRIFSFSMKPFLLGQQKKFLIRFWQAGLGLANFERDIERRLKFYADQLLQNRVFRINPRADGILGFPVLLRILAELFQGDGESQSRKKPCEACEEYLHSKNDKPNLPRNLNVTKLYGTFVERKFEIYRTEKKRENLTNLGVRRNSKALRETFLKNHQKSALRTLFGVKTSDNPSGLSIQPYLLNSEEIEDHNVFMAKIIRGSERTGIITHVVDGRAQFIHRTFAEYFAATFIFDTLLKQTDYNQDKERFLIRDILSRPRNEYIRAFLNGLMGNTTQKPCDRRECKAIDFRRHDFRNNRIFFKAASEGHYEIIKFLLNHIDEPERRKNLITGHSDTDPITVLHIVLDQQQWEELKWLIENGSVEVNCLIGYGRTILHHIASLDNLDKGKWLPNKRALLDALDKDRRTSLHEAVQFGIHLDIVKWLVNKGAPLDALDKDHRTPLHEAMEFGINLDIVKWLVNNGAPLDALDKDRRTPLHEAVQFGKLSILQWLVDEGKVNINDRYENGKTLLHYAVSAGRLDVVEWLVNTKNADLNIRGKDGNTALNEATHSNDDFNKSLIQPGPVRQFSLSAKPSRHDSLLYLQENRAAVVQWLVKYTDADVNIENGQGKPILRDAVRMKQWDFVKFLVEKKNVSVNVVCQGGRTVLLSAASDAEWDLVKWLLEDCRGADVHIRDDDGMTVLHYAASFGQFELIKWLVTEKGCDISVKTRSDMTLLHCAALSGVIPLIEWLVIKEKRMDVEARNDDGETVLLTAARAEKWDVVKLLASSYNADVHVESITGETVLFHAVRSNNVDMIKWLLKENGMNVEAQNDDGETVAAAHAENWDMVKALAIACNVDMNAGTEIGDVVLLQAVQSDNVDMIQWLVDHKNLNVDARLADGRSILHEAVKKGSIDVVRGLITKMNADPDEAEYEGWPILHAALFNNNDDILDLLLRYSSANKYAQDKDGNTFLRLAASRNPELYKRLVDEYDFESDIEDVVDENETSNFSPYAMETEDADIQGDEFPS